MFEKFVMFIDGISAILMLALLFTFTIGFFVSLLLGHWNAATAFGVGHIGLQMLLEE